MTYLYPASSSEEYAQLRGFTRRVLVDGPAISFEALIQPDADLDGTVEVFDVDNQEWGTVQGWIGEFTDLDDSSDWPDSALRAHEYRSLGGEG